MIYPTQTITLKNGTVAILRAPMAGDGKALIELLQATTGETDFLANYPEEITLTVEEEERWIAGHRDSPLVLDILCEIDGKIVGSCALTRCKPIKKRHRATVGLCIRQSFWNLGIGTAMLKQTLEQARVWNVEQIELCYVEGNERGARLYEKLGFAEVARHPDAIRLKDGTSLDEIFMIKKL